MGLKIMHFKALAAGLVLAAASSAFASPASADCVSVGGVYCDQTPIQAYNGTNPTNWGGPGFVSPGVGDVLQDPGHPFDTDKLVATMTTTGGNATLDLKFYTSFNGNDEGARYADVFLGSNPASPNSFNYAITVGDQAANGGTNTVGLYSVANSGAYYTSTDIWGSRTSYIYGGAFEGLNSSGELNDQFYASPTVVAAAAAPVANFAATVTTNDSSGDTDLDPSGNADYTYLVDVSLTATTADFDSLFGNGLSVFWGTGDCSNDAIEALLPDPPANVPEPVTASLFASGIGGLLVARRRKKLSQ
jgi:hypothetical protein